MRSRSLSCSVFGRLGARGLCAPGARLLRSMSPGSGSGSSPGHCVVAGGTYDFFGAASEALAMALHGGGQALLIGGGAGYARAKLRRLRAEAAARP